MISVIIPTYNEPLTILKTIEAVVAQLAGLQFEIIVVDDGSTQRPSPTAKFYSNIKIINLPTNHGKGYAVRQGIAQTVGDIIIIQDADLEYSPEDYKILLQPFERWNADVVYGSRFLGAPHRCMFFFHQIGNNFLTSLTNLFCNLNLSDMETGMKAFRAEAIKSVDLKENRFVFEPEVTIKLAKKKFKFYEVPITYNGRTYAEGKKIKWTDGLKTLWCILKYGCGV